MLKIRAQKFGKRKIIATYSNFFCSFHMFRLLPFSTQLSKQIVAGYSIHNHPIFSLSYKYIGTIYSDKNLSPQKSEIDPKNNDKSENKTTNRQTSGTLTTNDPAGVVIDPAEGSNINEYMPYTLDERIGIDPWKNVRELHIGEDNPPVIRPDDVMKFYPGMHYTDLESDKQAIMEYNQLGHNINGEPLLTQHMLEEMDEEMFEKEHIHGVPGLLTETEGVEGGHVPLVRSSEAYYFACESADEAFGQYLHDYMERQHYPSKK